MYNYNEVKQINKRKRLGFMQAQFLPATNRWVDKYPGRAIVVGVSCGGSR